MTVLWWIKDYVKKHFPRHRSVQLKDEKGKKVEFTQDARNLVQQVYKPQKHKFLWH